MSATLISEVAGLHHKSFAGQFFESNSSDVSQFMSTIEALWKISAYGNLVNSRRQPLNGYYLGALFFNSLYHLITFFMDSLA